MAQDATNSSSAAEEKRAKWRIATRKYRAAHPERAKIFHDAYRSIEGNREKEKISTAIWRSKNKERLEEKRKAWCSLNKEKIKAADAARWVRNKERLSKQAAAWRAANPELYKKAGAEWRANNKEKIRIAASDKRALKKRNSAGKLSPDIASRLLVLQRGKCAVCKTKLKMTGYDLDHIVPLSKGGAHADSNLQLTCPRCNRKKSNKDPIRFMQEMGYLL